MKRRCFKKIQIQIQKPFSLSLLRSSGQMPAKLSKNDTQILVYILCFLIAVGPAAFVFINYPYVAGKTQAERDIQVATMGAISTMPFIIVCGVFLIEWYFAKKK